MKTVDTLWIMMQNCFTCDCLLQQILLLSGYFTQEVRKKVIYTEGQNIPAIELLAEDTEGRHYCVTFMDADPGLWTKRNTITLSDEWYGDGEGERIIHRSPFDPKKSSLEYELYNHRVERVINYLVCFANLDAMITDDRERCTAGVPFVDNNISVCVPCPTVFLRTHILEQLLPLHQKYS